ncbi:hypothetical protein [Ilumatobacter sp.]|uniref:hypothetical protein n=1 Tax=Ilumatobacter sp. TaxID=1967498 RepID=UPI003750981C
MDSTTIKVSVATRDRIRSFGGATHEETIIEALDLLDAREFWAEADVAAAFVKTLPAEEQARRKAEMDELDAAFDALDG